MLCRRLWNRSVTAEKNWRRIEDVYEILREGTRVARETASQTLAEVKHAMKIDYFETSEFLEEQKAKFSAEK